MEGVRNEEINEYIPKIGEDNSISRSHLKNTRINQSKKTFFLTVSGLIVLIVILAIFGQSILINYSVLLGETKEEISITSEVKHPDFITSPMLDRTINATNSANVNLTGFISTTEKVQVRLYVNDELADVVDPDPSGQFKFIDIKLNEGLNKIKSKAVLKGKTSDYSNILEIRYLKNEPKLVIEYPAEGTSFTSGNSTLSITGKTDPGNSVTINGYTVIIKKEGGFTYDINMKQGDNTFNIIASDSAGNNIEKVIKVNYAL